MTMQAQMMKRPETSTHLARARRGAGNYRAGLAAEQAAERLYERAGARVVARRWRSAAGEIDLIVEKDGLHVFVEVKAARSHAEAAQALRPKQMARLMKSAEIFAGGLPDGADSAMRFDVVLFDGQGVPEVIPNALAAA